MAAPVVTIPAFSAVEKQLKTLCLQEFPCGKGSWREPEPVQIRPVPRGKKRLKPVFPTKQIDKDSLEVVKVQAQKEKSEALQELVNSVFSPWRLDYSWSEEAKELREIAVKSPWLIDKNFVLNYFKTLRIVDKNVSEVDKNLLHLKNLKELTLSANFITSVNSKNLPTSLRVLELCANQISDISGLCVRPPLLDHLGLGYNKISFLGDYITGDFWPNLLSLDLSHNDLCDLLDIVRKVTTLPKLRNLVLQGNPLSLIPGYRGYTIDSLRRLSVMDDIHISADEKHHFKGLARRREFILDEAKVQLGITYIKGLPCPEEIKNPEGQPEFPVVERTYFVQFMFPEEPMVKGGEGNVELADDMTDLNALEAEGGITDRPEDQSEHSTTRLQSPPAPPVERNVQINSQPMMKTLESAPAGSSTGSFPRALNQSDPEVKPGSEVEGIPLDLPDGGQAGEGEDMTTDRESKSEPMPRVRLAPINSEPHPWSEEHELNWTVDLTRDDLLALRDFFRQGMDFSVVEQVILGYPPEADAASEKNAPEGKESKDKRKDTNASTAKGKNSAKDKKKKKESEIELVKSPPTYTTIATFHITLEHFLDGEFEYRNIFTKGDVPPPSTVRSVDDDKKMEKKDNKKKASAMDKKNSNMNAKDAKDAKKSPRSKEHDKKGGKGKHAAEEAEDEDLPPPPLELEVTVKLHHWVTAMDSVKEEEEKNKSLQQAREKGIQGSKETLTK